MDFKDYYSVLGVSRTANEKEIKSAYRKLARECHPDVNPGDKKAEKRFQEINEAYEVLSDNDNRKKYDMLGKNWKHAGAGRGGPGGPGGPRVDINFEDLFGAGGAGGPNMGGGFGGSGFSSFFDRFFGGSPRGQRAGPSSPPPQSTAPVEVQLDLTECFTGTTRQIEVQQESACGYCHGQGMSGNGLCPNCQGAGRQVTSKRVEVKIPAGVTNDSKVKAAGHMICVKIKNTAACEVSGRDLTLKVPLPLYQALLGGELAVKSPNGQEFTLKIPPETQNGKQFRFSGKGLPGTASKPAGNLYVKVEVVLPTSLNERERQLFGELAALRK